MDIDWIIKPLDPTENTVELWYSGKDEFEIEVFYTDGTPLARLALNASGYLVIARDGKILRLAFASHLKNDPDNGDNVFQITQDPSVDILGGTWKLRIHGINITDSGQFHAWIERDSFGLSTFTNDDPNYTLGLISTGLHSIVVGSYDAHKTTTPISYFSSGTDERWSL